MRISSAAPILALRLDEVGAALDVVLKALAITGLVVYAIVRLAVDGFYKTFDVSAEEVGLTQSTIVGRAAIYLFVVGGSIGVATTLALILGPVFGGTLADPFASVFLVLFLTWAIWAVRWMIRERAFLNFAVYSLATLCIGFGIFFIMAGVAGVMHGRRWYLGEQQAAAIGAVLVVFGVAAWAWLEGRLMALAVLHGREVAGRILNLSAVQVFVTPLESEAAPSLDTTQPYLFLGEGERWLVLFDPRELVTIRIPTGKVAVVSAHFHFAPPLYSVVWDRFRKRIVKFRRTKHGRDGPETTRARSPRQVGTSASRRRRSRIRRQYGPDERSS